MSEDNKFKDFIDENINNQFSKPAGEFEQIVNRIEEEQSVKKFWLLPSVGLGGFAVAAIVFVLFINTNEVNNLSSEEKQEIVLLIEDAFSLESEDDFDDDYLALIE